MRFPTKLKSQSRITVPKAVIESMELKKGDIIQVTIEKVPKMGGTIAEELNGKV